MSQYEMTIEELDLGCRAYGCLKRAGINTLNELVCRIQNDVGELLKIRLGKREAKELLNYLFAIGLPVTEWLDKYIHDHADVPIEWKELYNELLLQNKEMAVSIVPDADLEVVVADAREEMPDISQLPIVFKHEEREHDNEHRRVMDYVLCSFPWDKIDLGRLKTNSNIRKERFIERGCIYAENQMDEVYVGDTISCVSSISIYPLNLLQAIFRCNCYPALLVDQFSNCIVEQIDFALSQLESEEEKMIRLFYQYGYTPEKLLVSVGLPAYSTLVWGFEEVLQKGLRKLRHPTHRRKLTHLFNLQWRAIDNFYKEYYNNFVNEIITQITEKVNVVCSIREVFRDYYSEPILIKLEERKNKWSMIEPIPVSQLGLTWELYAPLKQSGIETLADILIKHGHNISLEDIAHSGLWSVFGLHEDGIRHLLSIVKQHMREKLDPQYIHEIVEYAESLACGSLNGECEKDEICPDIACTALSLDVFDFLLRAGYRKKEDVFIAFNNGNMQAMYNSLPKKKFTLKQLKASIAQLSANKFPVWLIVSTDFWNKVLEQNSGASFKDIRKWYLSGKPLNTDFMELEEHISELFPIDNVAFQLLHRSRMRFLHWIWWPKELLRKCGMFVEEIDTAYWGGETYGDQSYLMIKKHNANGEQFALYSLNSSNDVLLSIIEEKNIASQILVNIYSTVCLNAEMFSDPAYGKSNTEGSTIIESTKSKMAVRYEAVQKHFAEYFLEHTSEDPLQQELNSFETISMDIAMWVLTNKAGIGLDTPIEELKLSIRAENCLVRAGIRTMNDLICQTRDSMMKVRNFGKKSVDEVVYKLEKLECPINIWGDE